MDWNLGWIEVEMFFFDVGVEWVFERVSDEDFLFNMFKYDWFLVWLFVELLLLEVFLEEFWDKGILDLVDDERYIVLMIYWREGSVGKFCSRFLKGKDLC